MRKKYSISLLAEVMIERSVLEMKLKLAERKVGPTEVTDEIKAIQDAFGGRSYIYLVIQVLSNDCMLDGCSFVHLFILESLSHCINGFEFGQQTIYLQIILF